MSKRSSSPTSLPWQPHLKIIKGAEIDKPAANNNSEVDMAMSQSDHPKLPVNETDSDKIVRLEQQLAGQKSLAQRKTDGKTDGSSDARDGAHLEQRTRYLAKKQPYGLWPTVVVEPSRTYATSIATK
jgi:hypothetical protein